jgi:hypothetical protein
MKKIKIEDQVFKIQMSGNSKRSLTLEFYVCNSNELNPYRETKELGVILYDTDEALRKSNEYIQYNNDDEIGINEVDELVKYLQKAKKHIKQFNDKSQPVNN